MPLHACFLPFLCLLLPLAFSLPKPGCQTRCGNLTIPYPFGVGSNCSVGPFFNVYCNTSTNPPKAYLSTSTTNFEVVEISGTGIRVKYRNLAVSCHNSSEHERGVNATEWSVFKIDLSSTPYTLSEDNRLTAIGCDDFVTIEGNTEKNFRGGCLCLCSNLDDPTGYGSGYCPEDGNGYSPGNGCCRTHIPRGTISLTASLSSDSHGDRQEDKLFPCSYAFVGEKAADGIGSRFFYHTDDLQNLTAFLKANPTVTSTPLLLDWRIGNDNCSVAKKNPTTFACRGNSVCNEATAGGYFCSCHDGYQGNPYLSDGCKDIDECKNASNLCTSICVNTEGGYNCACPRGYYGDGRRDSFGCRKLPLAKMISVSIGLGTGVGSLLLLSLCFWLHKLFQKRANKKQKEKFFKRNGGLLLGQQQQTNEGTIGKTKLFPAKELERATDNFNESRILGQGGQGIVYKGMLSDGQIVAIKKSKEVDENRLEQFINEVVILSQINHRNVVKLLGCCLETEVPLLVYEFVPNGTLFDLIHDPNTEFPVSWNMRLKIAADIAGALAYIHSATSLPIYHRDIKTRNILLDEKYVVKVSDFGTSKSVAADQTHVTTLVKGTFGYLDPEYFQSSQFTEKSDVYSFGVVLVELLTGQRAISLHKTEDGRSLATRFLISMERDCLDEILDDQVLGQERKDKVVAVARVAQRCLNLQGKMRPTMKEVATKLESVRMSQMPAASCVEDEFQEVRLTEAKMTILSDFEYSWTTTRKSVASSSSDSHPLMLATMRYGMRD